MTREEQNMNNAKTRTRKIAFVLFVCFLLMGGGVVCTDSQDQKERSLSQGEREKQFSSLFDVHPAFAQAGDKTLADIAESRIDGVVNISSTRIRSGDGRQLSPFFDHPFFRDFFGPDLFPRIPRERREKSLGSGVIVSADGTVLTNNHVVENAEEILVTLADGREFDAKIVGTDPQSDVAVIRLEEVPEDLELIPLGDSAGLRMGDVVLAIGNPFGLSHTVTMGIVSATGRANVGIADYEDFIQTDAAINPGNSGGALINLKGELVGINTAIVSRTGGYQGIGFAIPSNMAKAVMESLIEHGKVVRGWLGVMIQEIDRDLAEAMDLDSTQGVLISDVIKDSPADRAEMERGDVVVKFNGKDVDSPAHLKNMVAAMGPDARVDVVVLRDGEEEKLTLTLGELTEDRMKIGKAETDEGMLSGLTLAPLSPSLRSQYNIPSRIQSGVVITQVEPGSRAQQSGLQAGDVILEINHSRVDSTQDFKEAYNKADERILLLVSRGGNTIYLVLNKS
jgi:serine protease Do